MITPADIPHPKPSIYPALMTTPFRMGVRHPRVHQSYSGSNIPCRQGNGLICSMVRERDFRRYSEGGLQPLLRHAGTVNQWRGNDFEDQITRTEAKSMVLTGGRICRYVRAGLVKDVWRLSWTLRFGKRVVSTFSLCVVRVLPCLHLNTYARNQCSR